MTAAQSCIFCKIVAGEAPASRVHEDDKVVAFMAVPQAGRGHVLVVPREHYSTCLDLADELAGPLFSTTLRIARAVNSLYRPDGITLVQNNGKAAGQTVFHVHLHVLPRTQGVRVNLHDPQGLSDRVELDRLAADIRAAVTAGV